jgi:hypothetical protein
MKKIVTSELIEEASEIKGMACNVCGGNLIADYTEKDRNVYNICITCGEAPCILVEVQETF